MTSLIPATDGGYCLWIVTPAGYTHSRGFEEVAAGLSEAFADLGFDAPVVTRLDQIAGRAVVLGANLLAGHPGVRPPGLVLYNLEQVQAGSAWMTPQYLDLLRAYPVWDYSARNIAALAEQGIAATLCGIGYAPGLSRIAPAPDQDVDVLFIGSMNARRRAALDDLAARGVRVKAAFDLYGAARDALIARARIVINIHYYEAQVFEIVRVSYLLANRVCVVSETGLDDELEAPLREGIAFAPYQGLTQACLDLLADPARRQALGQAGFAAFSARPQAPMLRAALGALTRG
ncbi:hypothetical protein [Phenylobacterium aquaticum]|uniref:hypothetical protein n=1 Tax=Phenylobacterium aquaticum TaxID=1763816 RepID=UPI0026F323B5|nr:hypothetical protein [Phenylobacterium aquaticum]